MPDRHSTVEVPVLLPTKDECGNCVLRLKESMEQTKGVEQVTLAERGGAMTIHFDPDLLTVRSLEERARDACGVLAERFCHQTLVLGGLDCADCAKSVERAVQRRPGVLYAAVNFATSRLFVETGCGGSAATTAEAVTGGGIGGTAVDNGPTTAAIQADIMHTVRSLGYQVWTEEAYRRERKAAVARPFYLRNRRAVLTAVSFAFLLAGAAAWLTTAEPHYLAIVLLGTAIVVGGYPVARNGWSALVRTRNVDMNVLMTVAAVGAAAVGEWVEAALVVALFGLGETLESWAVERTRGSIQALMDLAPEEAVLRHGDHEERVPVDQVAVGDLVVVKPGARIPLDGVVLDGRSTVDESPITGESLPQAKEENDLVYAGTINQHGSLQVRVTSLARDSTLARLIQMVEEAQGQKAPSQRWVDSFARYYTPIVMGLAAATAVLPPLVAGASWGDWIYRALALLILACPCALVISTPVSIVSAIGAAGRQGVLIKGGAHLEAAGRVNVVAFDKTGTLTEGVPRVTTVLSFNGAPEDEILALAASVERDSEHPVADAITHAAAARDLPLAQVRDFEALPGRGARGRLDGSDYYVGNARLFADLDLPVGDHIMAEVARHQDRGETVILLGTADGALGAISVADQVRSYSRRAVADLHEAGVARVVMLTGDNRTTAAAVAASLGIDDYRAELLPAHKVDAVQSLMGEYGGVAMVGDGINDAPALATATVGIAMGAAGTDTALETADIALMADDLTRVPYTIRLSRAARRTVVQNIGFALALKVATLLLVFPGWLTLWMAVLADTGGSLIVIGNGLRLLRFGKVKDGVPTHDGAPVAPVGLPARRKARTYAESAMADACGREGCSCSMDGHLTLEGETPAARNHEHADPPETTAEAACGCGCDCGHDD